jgi:hypothetical protein
LVKFKRDGKEGEIILKTFHSAIRYKVRNGMNRFLDQQPYNFLFKGCCATMRVVVKFHLLPFCIIWGLPLETEQQFCLFS